MLLEQAREYGLGLLDPGRGQCLAPEQEAPMRVSHGERIAVDAVAGLELAFEVRAPHVVGGDDRRGGFARMADGSSLAWPRYEPIALQNLARRRARGQRPTAMAALQDRQQLLGTPRRMMRPQLDQRRFDVRRGAMWAGVRRARQLFESRRPIMQITIDPFVPRLATNAIVCA